MNERASKMQEAFRLLKVVRGTFLLGGIAFALAALVVALREFNNGNVGQALVTGLVGTLLGVWFGTGTRFVIGRFMESTSSSMAGLFEPPFEQHPTDDVQQQAHAVGAQTAMATPLKWETENTVTAVVDSDEVTFEFSPVYLFTDDDLRGNVDLMVLTSPTLTDEQLCERLHLRIHGEGTMLSCLAHGQTEVDEPGVLVLSFSLSDTIEAFDFDRPRYEKWIDEIAANPRHVEIFWDDSDYQLLCSATCLIVDS